MSAFSRELLADVARGDNYATRRFIQETTPRCETLTRWHLADRQRVDHDLLARVPRHVASRFIRLLRRNGVMPHPKHVWFRILVKTLQRNVSFPRHRDVQEAVP